MRPVALSVIFLAASSVLGQEPDFEELRRPLELPIVSASAECPASIGAVGVVPIEARVFGLPPGLVWFGAGPVYVLGWSNLDEAATFQRTIRSGSAQGAYGFRFKTPVVSDISYAGPILLRGRELETGREMTFDRGRNELILSGRSRLQLPTSGNPNDWRIWPPFFEMPEPGCYGIQIDTLIGSEVLIVSLPYLVNGEEASNNAFSLAVERQDKQALFLPRDSQLRDELSVAGLRELRLPSGLSRLIVPDSDTTYYVIDEVAASQKDIYSALSDIYQNDSDISIGTDQLRTDVIHLRVREETRDVRYVVVEPALLFQVNDFFTAGGYSRAGESMEVLEYQFPIDSCSELNAAIERMEALLRDSVSSIVPREPMRAGEVGTVSVDGAQYTLNVRLGLGLRGSFGVSQNNGVLFEAVRSIRTAVRECSMPLEPEVRAHDVSHAIDPEYLQFLRDLNRSLSE